MVSFISVCVACCLLSKLSPISQFKAYACLILWLDSHLIDNIFALFIIMRITTWLLRQEARGFDVGWWCAAVKQHVLLKECQAVGFKGSPVKALKLSLQGNSYIDLLHGWFGNKWLLLKMRSGSQSCLSRAKSILGLWGDVAKWGGWVHAAVFLFSFSF